MICAICVMSLVDRQFEMGIVVAGRAGGKFYRSFYQQGTIGGSDADFPLVRTGMLYIQQGYLLFFYQYNFLKVACPAYQLCVTDFTTPLSFSDAVYFIGPKGMLVSDSTS